MTTLISAALALCLTAAGATLAAAKHPARHHTQRTLTIYTVTAKDGLAVLPGQPGTFSLGDRVAFSDDLFTSKGATALDTDGGACTVTRVTEAATGSGVLLCEVTFSLPGGDIETQALNTLTNGGFVWPASRFRRPLLTARRSRSSAPPIQITRFTPAKADADDSTALAA